jgi:hypothetical protein
MKKMMPYVLAILMLAPLRLFAGSEDFDVKLVDVICACNHDYFESMATSDAAAQKELFIGCVKYLSSGKSVAIKSVGSADYPMKAKDQTESGCDTEAKAKETTLSANTSVVKDIPKHSKLMINELNCDCPDSDRDRDKNYLPACKVTYVTKKGETTWPEKDNLKSVKFANEDQCKSRMTTLVEKFKKIKDAAVKLKKASDDKILDADAKRK